MDVKLARQSMRGEGETERARSGVGVSEPEPEARRVGFEEETRIAIVGAGGYGRVALDVLIAAGYEGCILGFYDDAHPMLDSHVRGYPVLGDVAMLKSMLSVEPVSVVVAITDNRARLRVANSIRGLGGTFFTAVHPSAYLSDAAVVGDGTVVGPGCTVYPDTIVGSHCCLGPSSVVERDAVVGAGVWVAAGAVVGPGAQVGARAVLGQNSSVGRKAVVMEDGRVGALEAVERRGG